MNLAQRERLTEEEYLERERRSDVKHEFINGEAFAMARGTLVHALIAGNLITALNKRLGDRCLVLTAGMRVQVVRTRMYTYPDVSVVCGKPRFRDGDANTLLNPSLLVEVLSESTEAHDRGAKFAHYARIESLREYVLVSQVERRVEVYRRAQGDSWLFTPVEGDGTVSLPDAGAELPLAEVYANVEKVAPEPPAS